MEVDYGIFDSGVSVKDGDLWRAIETRKKK
jgi:hypothetical protein